MASTVHKISNYVPEPSLLKERLLVDVDTLDDGERTLLSDAAKINDCMEIAKKAMLNVQYGLHGYFDFLTSTEPDERWISLSDDLPEIQFVCSESLKYLGIGLTGFEKHAKSMRQLIRRAQQKRDRLASTTWANLLRAMQELTTLTKRTISATEQIQFKTKQIVESEGRRPIYRPRPSTDFSDDQAIEKIMAQTTKARGYLAR